MTTGKIPPLAKLGAAAASYKHVKVKLLGNSGNAMFIIGAVRKALSRAGATDAELAVFCEEAMSGDYDHLLATAMDWVTVK